MKGILTKLDKGVYMYMYNNIIFGIEKIKNKWKVRSNEVISGLYFYTGKTLKSCIDYIEKQQDNRF